MKVCGEHRQAARDLDAAIGILQNCAARIQYASTEAPGKRKAGIRRVHHAITHLNLQYANPQVDEDCLNEQIDN